MKKYTFKTVNGDTLNGYSWDAKTPVGNIVIVTGMEECSSRYDNFAQYLNENGFNVVCVDHYGQGENVDSIDQLGIVPPSFFSKTVKNIDDIIKLTKKNKLPTYLFGHSMGSFIVQDYVQRFATHVDKVVICGSNGPNAKMLFKLGFNISKVIATKKKRNKKAKTLQNLAIGSYSKSVKNKKTDSDWLSFNEQNVQDYIANPKCGYGSSNGFFYEFLKGNARLFKKKFLKKISPDINLLIIAGEEDPVGAFGKGPRKLYKMYKKCGVKNVNLKVYENMRHEVLNENNKEIVYKDILNFYQN